MALKMEQIRSGAWCVFDLLDSQECQEIVEMALDKGIGDSPAKGDVRHRNHNVLHTQNHALAQKLWERLKDIVPQEYEFEAGKDYEGFQVESLKDMLGRWSPSGIKADFTILFYRSGDHFGPHRDGYKIIGDHERSLLTLSTYLTDRPAGHGGATQFVSDEMDIPVPDKQGRIRARSDCIEVKVEADKAGKAILFQHDLMHEGETIRVIDEPSMEAAPKWLLLTQVLYQRDPSTAPVWTPDQYEARRFLALAEKAEIEGDISSAIRLYNRAYRLDPALEVG